MGNGACYWGSATHSFGNGHTMSYERFLKAAERVLEGDESRAAASDLEAAIVDEYLGDDRFSDLLEALALYALGSGMPYYNASDLRAVIRNLARELQ